MFIPGLERMGSEEQKTKWLPLATSYNIIGTYAQTELGHGTNLMKLETMATFDPSTDEFVMNTPRITSMKWWPGGLGKTSTHAIVLAQLYIGSQNFGLQAFIVQLRSLEDHRPLPGISLGDIGPKIAASHIDNGFLIMRNFRIPRENMLMGNAVVTRDGKFQILKSDKSNYSTMMHVRALITGWASLGLMFSVVSGVRYSAVRRQSSLKMGGEELQILDFQSQQYKMFPAVATAYGLFFTSETLLREYNLNYELLLKGNRDVMGEFHCQTSAMKALCAEVQSQQGEIVRRGCGGHGFMLLSGVGMQAVAGLSLNTVEGENTVLYQQTARYLLKQVSKVMSGESVSGFTSYLAKTINSNTTLDSPQEIRTLENLLAAYTKMAQRSVMRAAHKMQSCVESGLPLDEAWNNNMVSLVRAAQAHAWQYLAKTYTESVKSLQQTASHQLHTVLHRLCCLFLLYYIDQNAGSFLETEAVTCAQLDKIRTEEMKLLTELRPDMVGLVDAIDFPDTTLMSAIGCWDGNVYERMYKSALNEPMNKSDVLPAYHKYLRGMMKGTCSSKL